MSEKDENIRREEFEQLSHRVTALETVTRETVAHLRRLEEASAVPRPIHEKPLPEVVSSGDDIPRSRATEPPGPMTPVAPKPPPSPSPVAPSNRANPAPPAPSLRWEERIGRQWADKVGALLVLLGVGFFVKFAFDQGWINPTMRIGLGVLLGMALLGCGETSVRRELRSYGNALSATGLAVIYLSIYAGSSLYHLFGTNTSVGLLAATSVLGATLALRYDAQPLAVMSAVGAYLAPVLVSGGGGHGTHAAFLNYLMVVSAGFASLAFSRSWRGVQGFAFVATWFCAFATLGIGEGYGESRLDFLCATLLFGEFLATSLALRMRSNPSEEPTDLILLLGNPALYFALAYRIIQAWPSLPFNLWMAALAFGLAAFYATLAASPRPSSDSLLHGASIALGASFTVIGFAFGVPTWATLAWCAESLVLVWVGFRTRQPLLRAAGHIILVLALFRLLAHDLDRLAPGDVPFLNPRFFALAVVSGTLGLLSWLHRTQNKSNDAPSYALTGWTGMIALLGLGIALETPTYATLLWVALGFTWLLSCPAASPTQKRAFFGLMLGVLIVRTLAVDVDRSLVTPDTLPIFNLRFVTLAGFTALMGFAAFALNEKDEPSAGFSSFLWVGANLCLLFGLSLEVVLMVERWLNGAEWADLRSAKQFALSLLWAIYAGILLAWGFYREQAPARAGGLGLLGIVALKLLFVDLAEAETVWRIVAFIGVGTLILLVSLAYHRNGKGESTAA